MPSPGENLKGTLYAWLSVSNPLPVMFSCKTTLEIDSVGPANKSMYLLPLAPELSIYSGILTLKSLTRNLKRTTLKSQLASLLISLQFKALMCYNSIC